MTFFKRHFMYISKFVCEDLREVIKFRCRALWDFEFFKSKKEL